MALFRVWVHDDHGIADVGYKDVEAATAKEAAELATGHPVNTHGPLHTLCATVTTMADLSHSDGFFRKPRGPEQSALQDQRPSL